MESERSDQHDFASVRERGEGERWEGGRREGEWGEGREGWRDGKGNGWRGFLSSPN